MKKTLILLLASMSFYACKAQTVYSKGTAPEEMVSDNYYIKDINNEHDIIVGTWLWEDGDNSFEITLQEFEMYSYPDDSNKYSDAIFGKYKYVENGNVISETTNIETSPNMKVYFNFYTSNIYNIGIKDVVSLKSMIGKFEIISENTATLSLERREGVRINSPDDNGIEFSLPTNITLIKVE